MYHIVIYGNEALRRKSVRVEQVDDHIRQLSRDMLACMYAEKGVGLAAEQIGREEALVVIDVPVEEAGGVAMPLVLVNPEITALAGEQDGQEGCLSFPGVYVNVKRAATATVRFMDLDGAVQELETVGLLARAVQHELDHLNGVLLVDRMSAVQKVANAGRLKRLKKDGQRVSVA